MALGGYLELLRRNPHYRNLWLAQFISNLGDWFNLLASATLIASITQSGAAVSYLFLARLLPVFVVTPFAGVLVDRINRKAILVAADVLRALTVLGFLLVREPSHVWLFYLLNVLQFALSALYPPAHSAVLANVVAPRDLITANALDGFTWSSMLAIGALLGGIAAAFFGVRAAFVIDSLSFILSAFFVSRVQLLYQSATRGATRGGFLDFVDGLRYLQVRPFLLGLALVKASGALIWGAVNVLEVPLANTVFPINGSGALTLGLMYAAVGLGTGVGPLVLRRVWGDSRAGILWAIVISFALMSVGVMSVGLAPSLPWLLIAVFVRTFGTGGLWVFSATMLQSLTGDEFRGRVFAFEFTMLTLAQSIGTLWAGFAQDRLQLHVQSIFTIMALVSGFVTLGWLLFRTVAARRFAQANG